LHLVGLCSFGNHHGNRALAFEKLGETNEPVHGDHSAGLFAIEATLRKPHPPGDFTALFLELALWVLIPVSMWWWILFTRKRIRAQFH
jgi:hypothetical protein